MKLVDRFVLAAVNEKKERLYISRTYLRYGVAGIAMIELYRLGRLQLDDKKVIVLDRTSTGDSILDEVLNVISKTASQKRLNSWIYSMSYKVRGLEKRIMQRLEDNGFIRIDREKFLGLIPYSRYVVTNSSEKAKEVNNIRDILLKDNRTPDLESIVIISMANSCGFIKKFFSGDEKKVVWPKLRLIAKGTYFEVKDEAAQRIVTAVRKVIAATQAAAASAAGSAT